MIIGLSGWARVGKDTVADYLVANHGFTKLSFADPMREALLRLDPILRVGEGLTMSLSQSLSVMTWDELKSESPDIRPLLQRLGTEVGREMFGQNFWVELAIKEASKYENVVFADCRFKNEAQAIDGTGLVWRVHRPGFEAANDHISEHDLDDYFFNAHLDNSEDLDYLHSQVDLLLRNMNALKDL